MFSASERVLYGKRKLIEVICQLRFPTILSISAWASTRPVSFVALIETAIVRLETSSSISRIPPFHEKSTSGQNVQKCRYRSSCSFAAIFR